MDNISDEQRAVNDALVLLQTLRESVAHREDVKHSPELMGALLVVASINMARLELFTADTSLTAITEAINRLR